MVGVLLSVSHPNKEEANRHTDHGLKFAEDPVTSENEPVGFKDSWGVPANNTCLDEVAEAPEGRSEFNWQTENQTDAIAW